MFQPTNEIYPIREYGNSYANLYTSKWVEPFANGICSSVGRNIYSSDNTRREDTLRKTAWDMRRALPITLGLVGGGVSGCKKP